MLLEIREHGDISFFFNRGACYPARAEFWNNPTQTLRTACAALSRTIEHRKKTLGLTKRIGELQAQTSKGTRSGGTSNNGSGNGTTVTSASATARPVDLQAVFERSRQLQVVGARGVADYSALRARLNG